MIKILLCLEKKEENEEKEQKEQKEENKEKKEKELEHAKEEKEGKVNNGPQSSEMLTESKSKNIQFKNKKTKRN